MPVITIVTLISSFSFFAYAFSYFLSTAGKHGKPIPAMKACICQLLLQVMEPNAAERHRNYLSAQIKMPFRGYNCRAFSARVLQLNEYCKYLPCLKDEEGPTANLKRTNVPFDDIELSMIMLRAVPNSLSQAYWAKMGVGHFPTSVKEVVKELLLLEPEFRRNKQIQDIVEKNARKKTTAAKPFEKTGEGKSASNKGTSLGRIPKKGTPNGGKDSQSASSPKGATDKHCECCAQWSPLTSKSHNTSECKRWSESGEAISRRGRDRELKNLKRNFSTLLKQQRKLKKSMKKRVAN